MDPIFFHVKKVTAKMIKTVKDTSISEEEKERAMEAIVRAPKTHTFCFQFDGSVLKATWSKIYTGNNYNMTGDVFSRKIGMNIALDKMNRLTLHPPRRTSKMSTMISREEAKQFLFDHLPARIADTLPWYVSRAVKFFKIDTNTPLMIEGFSSSSDDQNDYYRGRAALVCAASQVMQLEPELD